MAITPEDRLYRYEELPPAPPGKVWLEDEDYPGNWYLVDRQTVEDPENYINSKKGRASDPFGTMCLWCEHLTPGTNNCAAFPDGIPQEITEMSFDHRWPHPQDGGIRFSPTEDAPTFYQGDSKPPQGDSQPSN